MGHKALQIFIGLLIAGSLCFLIYLGMQDKVDPEWQSLDQELKSSYQTLEHSIKDLDDLYQAFHQLEQPVPDSSAFNIMANPFLPTMEFGTFKALVEKIRNNQFILISGVSGVGTTTKTNRLAHFIASKPENLMEITCAPLFDLELHKEFIGQRANNQFVEGKLLEFLNLCKTRPKEKFVVLLDELDKINPETFFGPSLWRKLDDPSYQLRFDDIEVDIPDNFYLISVTHAGVSSRVELNNEHFRRLGEPIYLNPDRKELILYLREKRNEIKDNLLHENDPNKIIQIQSNLNALEDSLNLKRFVYAFSKSNAFIEQQYSRNHRLGQWSSLRKFYKPEDRAQLFESFIAHVNALKPDQALRNEDLDAIRYTLKTNGLLQGSNFINSQLKALEEKGFLSEFLVGLLFILLSGFFSWYFIRRRQQYIQIYTDKIHKLFFQFEHNELSYEEVSSAFTNLKLEVDELINKKKINYSEAAYFYAFIENRVKQIELSKEVNQNFRQLVDTFMEDHFLSENEYRKLKSFLIKIKNRISLEDYTRFNAEIESLYKRYGKH